MGKSTTRSSARKASRSPTQRLQPAPSVMDAHEFLMIVRDGAVLPAQKEDFQYTDVVIFECKHCRALVGDRVANLLEALRSRTPYCPVCLHQPTHVFELEDGLVSLADSLGAELKLSLAALPRCARCEAAGRVHDPFAEGWVDDRFIVHSGVCELDLLATDQLVQLDLPMPDPVRTLSAAERAEQLQMESHVCLWKRKPPSYFVRAVLPLPVRGAAIPCHLLLWVQVHPDVLGELQRRRFHVRGRQLPGCLANNVPGLPETLNLSVSLKLTGIGHRPLALLESIEHPLFAEQSRGITLERLVAYEEAHRRIQEELLRAQIAAGWQVQEA